MKSRFKRLFCYLLDIVLKNTHIQVRFLECTKLNTDLENVTLTNHHVLPADGLRKTISLMNELERRSFYKPHFVKWVHETFAGNCTPCIPAKIWKHVVENFEFISDEPFDERIAAPYFMNEIREGDCDDFALFIKTCIDILGGWNSSYILFAKERNNYSHIAVFINRGSYGNKYVDPVVVDGANQSFNIIPSKYKFYKTI